MILPSANCRRTSCTTTAAVLLTARIANDENRNAIDPPMSSPMNTFGSATLIAVCGSVNRALPLIFSRPGNSFLIVSMYDENNATAAMTAEPIANPFVTAFVVLPTASSITMIRCGSPANSPDITAMPAALSATGPKVSSDTTTPVVASMPMPVRATRYSENCRLPPPMAMATPMAIAMAMMAYTDDSSPELMPESTVVAGPVRADTAISWTGA